jgi:hypothetical protein
VCACETYGRRTSDEHGRQVDQSGAGGCCVRGRLALGRRRRSGGGGALLGEGGAAGLQVRRGVSLACPVIALQGEQFHVREGVCVSGTNTRPPIQARALRKTGCKNSGQDLGQDARENHVWCVSLETQLLLGVELFTLVTSLSPARSVLGALRARDLMDQSSRVAGRLIGGQG